MPDTAKPKAPVPAMVAAAAADTNLSNYVSVFQDLSAPQGRDPFYPSSHRRDPVPAVAIDAPARSDTDLVLKAVMHNRRHSQAVINNEILGLGEQESIRVPNGHLKVRCLDIGNDYVVVQVDGEAETKRLTMVTKKN